MSITINNHTPELEHVDTYIPQVSVNRDYVAFLEARIRRQHTLILEAQMWIALGEVRRARQTLCQGISE